MFDNVGRTKGQLFLFIVIFTLFAGNIAQKIDDIVYYSQEELEKENAACNAKRASGREECTKIKNCCYFQKYEPRFESHQPNCMGLNVFRQMHARNDTVYLKYLNLSNYHTSVKSASFCSIISADPAITDMKDCACGAWVWVVGGWVGLAVLATFGL